jgi:RHS repeat-associated protein
MTTFLEASISLFSAPCVKNPFLLVKLLKGTFMTFRSLITTIIFAYAIFCGAGVKAQELISSGVAWHAYHSSYGYSNGDLIPYGYIGRFNVPFVPTKFTTPQAACNDALDYENAYHYEPLNIRLGGFEENIRVPLSYPQEGVVVEVAGHRCQYYGRRDPDDTTGGTNPFFDPYGWDSVEAIVIRPVCLDNSIPQIVERRVLCRAVYKSEAPPTEYEPGDSPCSGPPNLKVGNPICLDSGAKELSQEDYATADGLLSVRRSYRSRLRNQNHTTTPSEIPGFGDNWHGLIPGRLSVYGSDMGNVEYLTTTGTLKRFLGSGNLSQQWNFTTYDLTRLKLTKVGATTDQRIAFLQQDVTSVAPTGELRLAYSNGDYILLSRTGSYDALSNRRYLVPVEKGSASGYKLYFDYNDLSQNPFKIRDNLGRQMLLTWTEIGWTSTIVSGLHKGPGQPTTPARMTQEKAIAGISLPDGTSLAYTYGVTEISGWKGRLETVKRLSATNVVLWGRTYHYEDARFTTAITGISDHNANRLTTYSYDATGRAISTELAGGVNRYQIVYGEDKTDGTPHTRQVTNPLGRVANYAFTGFSTSSGIDPNKVPRRIMSIDGQATADVPADSVTFSYSTTGNSAGTLTGTTDAKGYTQPRTNDANALRPTLITEASGTASARGTNLTWHSTFDLVTQEQRTGLKINYTYDTQGRMLTRTETDTTTHTVPYSTANQTRKWTYTWNANGRVATINGPRAATGSGTTLKDDLTKFIYDTAGNLLTTTNGLNQVTTFAGYDANGRPGTMTSPNGIVTAFTYDPLGRTKTVTIKHPTISAQDAATTFDYDTEGRVTRVASPLTDDVFMDYDLAGRMTAMRATSGERIDYAYDAMNNVTARTTKRGDLTVAASMSRTFDALGRMLTETFGPGRTKTWAYDKNGNPTEVVSARNFATAFAFDPLNRVISTVAPDNASTTLALNTQDKVTSNTDALSVATTFVRNGFGEIIREVSPDRGTSTYYYDAGGTMTASIDGRGQRVDYTYDVLGRVLTKKPVALAAQNITYSYDAGGLGSYQVGHLTKVIDGSSTTSFQYDHRGNLLTKQQAIGTSTTATLTYAYDLADRITQITYPSARIVSYARDSKGRITEVITKANATAAVVALMSAGTYESFGSLKTANFGNGTALAQSWGNDGRLASKRLFNVTGGVNVSSLTYAYDNDDNITGITDAVMAANSLTYAYDNRGRLVQVVSGAGAYKRQDFVYDANGNRTSVEWRANAADTTASATDSYVRTAGTNRLASVTATAGTGATAFPGTRSFTLDARGNLASESRPNGASPAIGVTTTYDGYGRLTGYSRSSGITNQNMVYNGMDDRVAQTTTTGTALARFVYDSRGRLMGEYLASATDVKGEYVYLNPDGANDNQSPFGGDDGMGGYGLLAVATKDAGNNPVIHWIHSNHLGAPMVTTDNSGIGIAPGSYTQAVFPGQMRTHADLYYNRYRDYDPTTGRYIQADPIGLAGGSNPYLYANDNPMRYTDPTGEFVPIVIAGLCAGGGCEALGVAAVAVIGGLIYEYNNHVALPEQYRGGICFFRGSHDGGFGGSGAGNPPNDNTGDRCKQEWDDAEKICKIQFNRSSPNPSITGGYSNLRDCAKGLVSRRCGGNRPDYEHDPYKPKSLRPKNWR